MKQYIARLLCSGLIMISADAMAISLGSIEKITKDTVKVAQTMSIGDKEEVEIGTQMHPRILSEFGGEVSDKKLKGYVEGVGQKLVKVCDRSQIKYHFTVLNSQEFNAFALPGGYVYVTRGLLTAIKDESELAAVLGHEITHVTHKHGIKKLQTATLGSTAVGYGTGAAAGAVGGAGGALAGEALSKVSELFLAFAVQGYGRENERDADQFGIRFSNQAGYDANGAVRMFEYLLSLEKGSKPKGMDALLASHPNTAERIKLAKKEVAALPKPLGATTNQSQFEKAIKALR